VRITASLMLILRTACNIQYARKVPWRPHSAGRRHIESDDLAISVV